jgi:short-subunit dehydrogenase
MMNAITKKAACCIYTFSTKHHLTLLLYAFALHTKKMNMNQPNTPFTNTRIVITGASKGIGLAIAEAFAAQGATILLCARNEVQLYHAVNLLQTQYPQATLHAMPADLADKTQTLNFADWVNGFGAVDILVNNAGQFLPGSIHNEPEGLLEQMIQVNLYSAYHLTRALLPPMLAAKKGQIFNICSIASLKAYSNGGSYSISKFALMGFSKNLREELLPHGIKVSAVYPGAVLTASWGNFDNSAQRIMEASDVAQLIVAASQLSAGAVMEDIVLRPLLGDL